MSRGYGTRDVAALAGLTERQVREYARAGLVEPSRGQRRQYLFSFRDLVLLRTARSLRDADVPHARIRRALERLRDNLPTGRSLSEVSIRALGDEVVVAEAGAPWNPESGQISFDFDVGDLATRVEPLARRAAEREEAASADELFALGVELEPVSPGEARLAYEKALELAPEHSDALVNLGKLLHDGGAPGEAAPLYRRALAVEPRNATAWFNLGVALEDLDRSEEAVAAYGRALDADRSLADAHYNLARLHERLGHRAAAIRHLRDYRDLTRGA